MTSPWVYTNVSTKQGLTEGEFMFDFTLHELGRTPDQESKVRTDLETLFHHNLSSTKLELIFLTLQEFQYLTIKHGDFFLNTRPVPAGIPEVRKTAFDHFCGISAGVSGLDNMNTVRVANMARSFDGSRIAIQKLGVWERAFLYFNKTIKKYEERIGTISTTVTPGGTVVPGRTGYSGILKYRDIANDDSIVFLKHTFDINATITARTNPTDIHFELRNENPSVHFVVDNRTLPTLTYSTTSSYYFFATICEPAMSTLMNYAKNVNAVVHKIGFIAAVHKSNNSTPLPTDVWDDAHRYYQIISPSMQQSKYSVVLTNTFDYEDPHRPSLSRTDIGASLPMEKEKENISTGAIKRTAADANLNISASATSSKLNRKTSAASTATVNPAS